MSKRDYIGALIASCISVFAYQTGFFFFLFLVPLQLLLFRSGLKVARVAVLGVGIALVYLGIKHTAFGNGDVRGYLLLVELVIPFLLLGGFLLENGFFGNLGGVLLNALLATAITALVSIAVLQVLNNEAFIAYYKAQFAEMFNILKSALAGSSDIDLIPMMDMDVDTMLVHVSSVFYKGFLFAYFCILFLSYTFALSVERLTKHEAGIITVMIPDYFVWVLIAALSLVLIDARFQPNPVLGYVGWNVFLIVMLLYGLRGLGLIRQMLEVRKVHPVVRYFIAFATVILLLHPRYGRVLLVGIPLIGISEIWFKYKRT
ncbi:MAG: DUF2232 domain-containing protein [Spirochaetia bacterium]|nr:DUF2232 domain-containing protein [Spirochaetales bacterium]MBR4797460.1 DUF2232 domain-containing protein [Spirochaetia bacterium]MBR5017121.1 DUF2232 domain-containing protein [Spirochaetia bacterium]